MDQVPPKHRTWTTSNYAAYWISDAANFPIYDLVFPSSESSGLHLFFRRQALLAIALGHIIIAVVVVLNGTIGARLSLFLYSTGLCSVSSSAISALCLESSSSCFGLAFRPSPVRASAYSLSPLTRIPVRRTGAIRYPTATKIPLTYYIYIRC